MTLWPANFTRSTSPTSSSQSSILPSPVISQIKNIFSLGNSFFLFLACSLPSLENILLHKKMFLPFLLPIHSRNWAKNFLLQNLPPFSEHFFSSSFPGQYFSIFLALANCRVMFSYFVVTKGFSMSRLYQAFSSAPLGGSSLVRRTPPGIENKDKDKR